jgi:hypothetical protein
MCITSSHVRNPGIGYPELPRLRRISLKGYGESEFRDGNSLYFSGLEDLFDILGYLRRILR